MVPTYLNHHKTSVPRHLLFTAVSSIDGESSQFCILLAHLSQIPPCINISISVSTLRIAIHLLIKRWSFKGSTTAPSHQLVQALLALSEAVEQLRITKDDAKWNEIMQNNFNLFVTSWADASHLNSDLQKSYDLALLRHMAAGHRIEHLAGSAETFEGENKENVRVPLRDLDCRSWAFFIHDPSWSLLTIAKRSNKVLQSIWRVHRLFLHRCFLALPLLVPAYPILWTHPRIYYLTALR